MTCLHATFSGDFIYLWCSKEPLENLESLEIIDAHAAQDAHTSSLFKNSIDEISNQIEEKFSAILSDSTLVTYSISSFYVSLPVAGKLSYFEVPKAVIMSPAAFVDLCSSFRDELEENFTLQPSFLFWNSVSKLILRFLSRGLYFPSIIRKSSIVESVWKLYWKSDEVKEEVSALAKEMPYISLVITPDSGARHLYKYVERLVEKFLNEAVDPLIRSFLNGADIFEFETGSESGSLVRSNRSRRMDLLVHTWAKSLIIPEKALDFSLIEQSLIFQRIEDWNKNLRSDVSKEDAQLTIRIIAPELHSPGEAFDKDWEVQLSLILKDGSELLPNSNLTKGDWTFLFLRELGKAIEVSRILDTIVQKNFSTSLSTSVELAYQLITRDKQQLERIGVSVIPPFDWRELKTDLKVILKVSPDDQELLSTQDPSTFSLQSLVNFSWDIAVDGTELTAEEVKSIVEGGQSVFYKDGRWISVDVSSFKTKLEEIKSLIPQRKLSLFEALRLGLGGVDSSNPLEILRIDAEGWIREILNFSDTSKVEERLPDSFKGQLRPYQLVGLSWLNLISKIHIGGCLADDMGLGKTVQVLALLALEFEDKKLEQLEQGKKSLSPNLLVVPMSILGNWEAEAKKFVPELKVYVHHGNTRESGTSFSDTILSCDLIITTYSLLYRDYRLFRKHSWHRVILDEAQNIKNIDAKQTKAVRALLEDYSYKNLGDNRFDVLPRRLALTGTPLENRLIELWSILDFLNPGLLGGIEDFKRRFVNQIEKNRDSEQAKKLSNLIKPFILRRTKLDPEIVADLPEKIEIESIVHLTPEQAKLYRDTLDEMLPRVKSAEGLHRKGIVLSTITRLKQICVHPELVLGTGADLLGRSGKLEFLEEILETVLAEGDRVLIFSQFAKWGSLLSPYLAKKLSTPIPFFHGGLARHDREKIIKEFQEPNGPPILMLSLKAGGFGLNLTAANQVVHLDQWWNPAVQAQATDRAYRIGQKSNVQVRTVISKGTLEEKINEMHKKKIELTNSIVETTKNSITELSTEALEELLTLQS